MATIPAVFYDLSGRLADTVLPAVPRIGDRVHSGNEDYVVSKVTWNLDLNKLHIEVREKT
jgi:hypothetical protein